MERIAYALKTKWSPRHKPFIDINSMTDSRRACVQKARARWLFTFKGRNEIWRAAYEREFQKWLREYHVILKVQIQQIPDNRRANERPWTVLCRFCKKPTNKEKAHRHGGGWVGECCWDERLRATE